MREGEKLILRFYKPRSCTPFEKIDRHPVEAWVKDLHGSQSFPSVRGAGTAVGLLCSEFMTQVDLFKNPTTSGTYKGRNEVEDTWDILQCEQVREKASLWSVEDLKCKVFEMWNTAPLPIATQIGNRKTEQNFYIVRPQRSNQALSGACGRCDCLKPVWAGWELKPYKVEK